jgi:predicted nucleic acid-binding protein
VTLCVVDASVSLSWGFKDETSPYAEYILDSLDRDRALVPAIWPLELINAMLSAVKNGRIQQRTATRTLAYLFQLPVDVDQEVAYAFIAHDILDLGLIYRLSAYDASYLELALRRGLPLATQDRKLADAALAAGVELLQP